MEIDYSKIEVRPRMRYKDKEWYQDGFVSYRPYYMRHLHPEICVQGFLHGNRNDGMGYGATEAEARAAAETLDKSDCVIRNGFACTEKHDS